MIRNQKTSVALVAFAVLLTASCGFKRKKYDNPISKDTQQPDKVLFDKAVKDIEHGRFEVARLTLNTLINTYDTSEFLAKAKLAIADSWYREGGLHGSAQAEAEYKDFELFYPTMPEAAESQKKICDIHFNQMQKADRDPNNGLRAEQECKAVITQYPNSKFVPEAEQELRQVQEVLAEAEYDSGLFYHNKGSHSAAANRFNGLVDQYPLYSHADAALWLEADDYSRMGPRFRQKQGEALAKIVKDYPLSPYADQARTEAGVARNGRSRGRSCGGRADEVRERELLAAGHASFGARVSRRAAGREPCGEGGHSYDGALPRRRFR